MGSGDVSNICDGRLKHDDKEKGKKMMKGVGVGRGKEWGRRERRGSGRLKGCKGGEVSWGWKGQQRCDGTTLLDEEGSL